MAVLIYIDVVVYSTVKYSIPARAHSVSDNVIKPYDWNKYVKSIISTESGEIVIMSFFIFFYNDVVIISRTKK